jgi:hypothetical protein
MPKPPHAVLRIGAATGAMPLALYARTQPMTIEPFAFGPALQIEPTQIRKHKPLIESHSSRKAAVGSSSGFHDAFLFFVANRSLSRHHRA